MISYLFYLILISVIATTCMTLFSYFISNKVNRQFREPEMLNSLIQGSKNFTNSVKKNHVSGWLIHYAIGFAFVIVFLFLYNTDLVVFDYISFLTFGICAGILAVIGWQIMFMLNNDPPKVHLKYFYLQLIIAHLVFTFIVIISFYFLDTYDLL